MDVIYTPPTEKDFYDTDARSVKSDVKSIEAPTSVSSTNAADMFEDTEIFHPKINQPKTINVNHEEWIIQVGWLIGKKCRLKVFGSD